MEIGRQTAENQPRVAERVLGLLRSLAEIDDGFVTDQLTHCLQTATMDFQGRHYYGHFGLDANAREKYRGHEAFELAEQFADDWDQKAFDPGYDTLPLEHFEPKVRAIFAKGYVPQSTNAG